MKNGVFSEFKIFAGNSNTELAEEIAAIMGQPLGKSTVSKFSDGEISVSHVSYTHLAGALRRAMRAGESPRNASAPVPLLRR